MNPLETAEALESVDAPPPPRGEAAQLADWKPDQNPTQVECFHDPAETVFIEGEKGGGKTVVAGDIIVRHAYENDNALCQLITSSIRTGSEGIWHDLETLVLPRWRDGNQYPPFLMQPDGTLIDHPQAGEYMDHGIGLEYTPGKLDPLTKDRHRWIRNMHGGWSKLLLISIPYASMVEDRVKGPAPSLVYVDELTNCGERHGDVGREYYTFPSAQLGRRRDISGPQQYVATMNPKGPSHWAYKIKEENADNPNFSVHKMPIFENLHRLPRGYVERLKQLLKTNPVEYDRLIKGEWVDAPTGEALFNGCFIPQLHVKGDAKRGIGLLPKPGFPIIIGYDLGQVWNCATFMQVIPTKDGKLIWIIFDEIDHLGEKIRYSIMAREVIARLDYWNRRLSEQRAYQFQALHFAGDDSVSQWRPGSGSYDSLEFEKEFNKEAERRGTRPAKIKGCSRGPGTLVARVMQMQEKLCQEELFVSATCPNAVAMFNLLEGSDDNPMEPKPKSKQGHKWMSISHPIFEMEVKGSRRVLNQGAVTPSLIVCGSR